MTHMFFYSSIHLLQPCYNFTLSCQLKGTDCNATEFCLVPHRIHYANVVLESVNALVINKLSNLLEF